MSPTPYNNAIVYVDESGDHGPVSPEYPIFVLAFCIFKKLVYAREVTTAIQEFKFRYFGHDAVVLHEREIRKSLGRFSTLLDKTVRDPFLADLTTLVEEAPFTVIAFAIRKDQLEASKWQAENPYHLAMRFCIERLVMDLHLRATSDPLHVVWAQVLPVEKQNATVYTAAPCRPSIPSPCVDNIVVRRPGVNREQAKRAPASVKRRYSRVEMHSGRAAP